MSATRWTETPDTLSARWHSENRAPVPRRVTVVHDGMGAATACRLARAGTAILWRGDFHQARGLLSAMDRRLGAAVTRSPGASLAEVFHAHRRDRARRARVLGMLVVRLDAGYTLRLRRAPDVARACAHAYGPPSGPVIVSLRELLGVRGAYEWHLTGVDVPALGSRIHPHYGVFSPVRGEYVDLVARAPLPPAVHDGVAFDIGTGTGVLAAVLARRGAGRVVATDASPRALACARDNLRRLGLDAAAEVTGPALYPPRGRAQLVVCNPPWLPGRPSSELDAAVHDPGGRMLHGFLDGLAARLAPGGEGWLVLSDLAELLGLRTRRDLLAAVGKAGLRVIGRLDTAPRHRRAADRTDPLHAARAAETTSLWRLAPANGRVKAV